MASGAATESPVWTSPTSPLFRHQEWCLTHQERKKHPGSYLWQWDWGWESITARNKGINSPNRHFGISLSTEIFAMKERAVWTLLGSPGFDWCPQDFALEEDSWSLFTLFLALRILENWLLSQNEGFSCGSLSTHWRTTWKIQDWASQVTPC